MSCMSFDSLLVVTAAWTAGGLVVALRHGIEELYHWHFLDHVNVGSAPRQTLIYGWA